MTLGAVTISFYLVALAVCITTLLTATPVYADRRLTIINLCPEAIPIYINGELQGNGAEVPSGESIERTFPDSWNGLVYTNANAPNSPGNSGVGTTRVGFENTGGYYYLIKDPSQFNIGVNVVPDLDAVCSPLSSAPHFAYQTSPFSTA